MEDSVSVATRFAIKRAKRRKSSKVTGDDLLMGLFQAIGRFGIVQIGHLTIDLEDLGDAFLEHSENEAEKTNKQKVAYSSDAVAIFEKAAHIARKDNSLKVELIHLLVAFAYDDNGLMAKLKMKYGFSSMEWRSALSTWQSISSEKRQRGSETGAGSKSPLEFGKRDFFSPDEAAEFLGVHTQTVRGYIRTGKLSAMRLAGERALRIKRDALVALLEPYKPDER